MSAVQSAAKSVAKSVDHYENFPVASWLCPPRLRPPIVAIYHFARTADDLADEGDAPPAERLAALQAYRDDLFTLSRFGVTGAASSARWPEVFTPLAVMVQRFKLPIPLLDDLLSAFMQDVTKTRYANHTELLDYSRRSANPIGRLLLHLYGVADAPAFQQSDAICSSLQFINFWQDLSVDHPRGRIYLPLDAAARHGVSVADLLACRDSPPARALVAEQCTWARQMMNRGAPLVRRLPGRAGWELRLVVQGGLRILDKIEALGHATLVTRPTVGRSDAPLLLWRSLRM